MPTEHLIRLGNLAVDKSTYGVRISDKPVVLSYLQFELLLYLASHPNQIISAQTLLENVWGLRPGKGSNTRLRIQVYRLRRFIQASSPWKITTVSKRGYGLIQAAGEAARKPSPSRNVMVTRQKQP
ncbi:MAG: winged helix-turn-helix transcriptional regulator [Chloroflexi bacterium]|nr:winged helix-turn-helix transcriptional regulator [Chloroflexota bacterium]